jgi:adenosylhomocysteine nucleosidase
MRFAIFAALPQELEMIIKDFDADKGGSRNSYQVYYTSSHSIEIALVVTSMGSANALAALESICMEFSPDVVVSAGYGGALYMGAAAGELLWSSGFISFSADGRPVFLNIPAEDAVFERIAASVPIKKGTVITIDKLTVKKNMLGRLPEGIQNPVCDMETFVMAKYCLEKKMRFFSIRAVSDLVDDDIPQEIADLIDTSGKPDIQHAIRLILHQPALLPLFIRLGQNSHKASHNLRLAVTALIREFR